MLVVATGVVAVLVRLRLRDVLVVPLLVIEEVVVAEFRCRNGWLVIGCVSLENTVAISVWNRTVFLE